jgi:predicted component of type VI protein secretion system
MWYLELVTLLADLSIFSPDLDVMSDSAYEHDNVVPLFVALHARIKSSLKSTAPAASLRVEFRKTDTCYAAPLADVLPRHPTEYYLVIRSKQESDLVRKLVQDADRFKLMPPKRTRAALFGMGVEKEEIPPPHLNVPRGAIVFRLVRASNPERWKEIEEEKSITAYWQDHRTSDFEIALHMTLPP